MAVSEANPFARKKRSQVVTVSCEIICTLTFGPEGTATRPGRLDQCFLYSNVVVEKKFNIGMNFAYFKCVFLNCNILSVVYPIFPRNLNICLLFFFQHI